MSVYRLFHLRLEPGRLSVARDAIKDAMIDGRVTAAIAAGLYDEVARIEAPQIHDIFELSNSIDHHWSENRAILSCLPGCRSTMIGDLVLDADEALHSCTTFGWDELPQEVRDAFTQDIGIRVAVLDQR